MIGFRCCAKAGGLRLAGKGVRLGMALLVAAATRAGAEIEFRFTLDGLAGVSNPTAADLKSALESNARAGFRQWTRWCAVDALRSIEVAVRVAPYATGTGGGNSATSVFVRNTGGLDIFEEGVAAEIRSGTDPNGTEPDMLVTIDPTYLRDVLWFDPEPTQRTAAIAGQRVDAVSFFAHEFGHVIAFNGWGDTQSGAYPGNYRSRFDALARWDGSHWFYTGPTTRALYGGDVPLSKIANSRTHYGNPTTSTSPGRDAVLTQGLMNGVAFEYRTRYSVGLLDLAFLRDQEIALEPTIQFTAPNLRVAIGGDAQARVEWLASPLAHYRVEASGNVDGPWSEVATHAASSLTSDPRLYVEPLAGLASRFYRLRVIP